MGFIKNSFRDTRKEINPTTPSTQFPSLLLLKLRGLSGVKIGQLEMKRIKFV